MKNFIWLIVILLGTACKGQVSILPDDKDILYTGRISFSDPMNPSFSLNGVSIKVNFTGTKISGRFSGKGGKSYLYAIIDGNDNPYERNVIEISGHNESTYTIAENLGNGAHSLELVKLNESGAKVTFHGLIIENGDLTTKPERPDLQFEFIGDSNTAGWAAWNAYDKGSNDVSGGYFTFPGITSRLLGAEFSLIGGSGSGIGDRASWNLTRVYDRIHLTDDPGGNNQWNFSDNYWNFNADAVVVNLGANDYYAATPKAEIKAGWKNFITQTLRPHYPNAHIVLANSYGWAYNEPADYVHEAIEELINQGETNVSFVRFPWLWGQAHAVINEHAGFANLLAIHLAEKLNLPAPELSPLTSFTEKGEIYNGSFEKSILTGIADAWRPHGQVTLIQDKAQSLDGENCIQTAENAWVNFATEVELNATLNLNVWAKADEDIHSGFIRIEFKDQAQKTIKTQQIQPNFTTDWQEFSTSVKVPEGVWSAWIVLASGESSTLYFDKVELEMIADNTPEPDPGASQTNLYPNPATDFINIPTNNEGKALEIINYAGQAIAPVISNNQLDVSHLAPGAYFLRFLDESFWRKFIKL